MQQREVKIVNTRGLNALASGKLAQLAVKYQCDVSLTRNGRWRTALLSRPDHPFRARDDSRCPLLRSMPRA
jgi:hypothetical protein